ncbi:MraY family glycosyltransferase [Fulvivirgaceae bacterium BMA10]|uniref:MraY family glycosyltransferase n=1 Tax=Splendidivirga corallicola TaxID=3051826 RepID=A0ABT8KVP9_9BACT|nr:MraY family glycosyltransferase [Fulvivirgaceae bacterium BMA10]
MLNIVLSILWAFLVAVFAVPSIIFVSYTKKLLDEPNHRSTHESLIPRLGGLAIFAGFMSALTIFGDLGDGVQQLLAGCLIIFFIGVKDDIITVSAFKKFFVQLLAAGIVMIIADIRITSFQGLFGIYDLEIGVSYAFTFFVIIGVTNAINLIDGLDGLAGCVVVLISLTFGTYFYIYDSAYAYVAFCLAGGVLGFLKYNIHKAKIFMGDTGSLLCGFIIAVMAIQFVEMKIIESAPAVTIGILIIPIFDTTRVFAIRIFNGRWPFHPDRNHIHHRLLDVGFSQLAVVILLIGMNLLVISFTILFASFGSFQLLLITTVFAICISFVLDFAVKEDKEDKVNA